MTTQIVAAYVGHNSIPVTDLPNLISTVALSLSSVSAESLAPETAEKRTPAVSIGKSVTPEYLICLEDGRKLKMLKRYLRTVHGMTPDEYRARWKLPSDYPMIAPVYAAERSNLAKRNGLGIRNSGRKKA